MSIPQNQDSRVVKSTDFGPDGLSLNPGCVSLGKLLSLSVPQLPHCEMGVTTHFRHRGIVRVKC